MTPSTQQTAICSPDQSRYERKPVDTTPPTITAANKPRKPADPDALIFTIQEAAYLLRCSVSTVRRRIAEGAPHSQRGTRGRIKISRDDLPHYYEMDRVAPQPRRRARRPRTAA